MEDSFKIGPFTVNVRLREISLTRDNGVVAFQPSVNNHAADLILDAMRIETYKRLPARLVRNPFVLYFREKNLELRLEEQNTEGIKFTFEEGDSLIYSIKAAFDKWIDISKANPSALSPAAKEMGDMPFDGR